MTFRKNLRSLLLATSFLASAAAGWAEPQTLTVLLSGATEVPPVETPAKGTAMLIYDPATAKLSWTVEYLDLTGPATMAHFHGPAQPGGNAPAVIWLTKKGESFASPIVGEATLTPEQAQDFSAGLWYVNVHTAGNPSGEIRGWIPAAKMAH